jgi:hypothetical protein
MWGQFIHLGMGGYIALAGAEEVRFGFEVGAVAQGSRGYSPSLYEPRCSSDL